MSSQYPTVAQRNPFRFRGIYAITDDGAGNGKDLLDRAKAALDGGSALLQFRSKTRELAQKQDLAGSLLQLCRSAAVPLLINDDVMLCSTVAADGVHLGPTDMSPVRARKLLGSRAIIGVTCNGSVSKARLAESQGADYVAFGPFYPSFTKPGASAVSPTILTVAKSQLSIPTVAIGGINVDNGPPLIVAGADMLAMVHALFGSNDVYRSARALTALFDSAPPDKLGSAASSNLPGTT